VPFLLALHTYTHSTSSLLPPWCAPLTTRRHSCDGQRLLLALPAQPQPQLLLLLPPQRHTMAQKMQVSMLFSSTAEEEAFMREADLRRLLPHYRPSRLSQQDQQAAQARLVWGATNWDVLTGRNFARPGNNLLRKVIRNSREFYSTLGAKDRRRAQDALIGFFESRGARFLEPVTPNGAAAAATDVYREASYYSVMEKIRKAMRDSRAKGAVAAAAAAAATERSPRTAPSLPLQYPQSAQHAQPTQVSSPLPPNLVQPGDRLGIFWPQDNVYYPGTVARASGTFARFHYEDGEKETIDLARHKYVVLGKSPVYEEWFSLRKTALHKQKAVGVGQPATAKATTVAPPPAVTPKSSSMTTHNEPPPHEPFADSGTTTSSRRRVSLPPQAKPSPDSSTQTEKTSNPPSSHQSTASSEPRRPPHHHHSKQKKGRRSTLTKTTPVVWAGKFKPTVAAPAASSLAAFLSHKVKRVE
jgi:hypothetical protein